MIKARGLAVFFIGIHVSLLAACGGDGPIVEETCDEVQAYQLVTPGKKIVVPEGLDELEEFKEMPVPKSSSPARPPGLRCIDAVPAVIPETG